MFARLPKQRVRFGALLVLSMVTLMATAQVALEKPLIAQPTTQPHRRGSEVNKSGPPTSTSGPSWQELTPAQRLSLQPLAANWNSLEVALKRKWIALAANYPSLTPAEQGKLHSRMSEWSMLSKEERARARLNFAESKNLSSDQKVATWEAYQALDPEEKKKLAASAPPKPSGAAGAAKPVAPQKLATVPLRRKNQTPAAAITSPKKELDSNTLLPLPTQVIEPAPKAE